MWRSSKKERRFEAAAFLGNESGIVSCYCNRFCYYEGAGLTIVHTSFLFVIASVATMKAQVSIIHRSFPCSDHFISCGSSRCWCRRHAAVSATASRTAAARWSRRLAFRFSELKHAQDTCIDRLVTRLVKEIKVPLVSFQINLIEFQSLGRYCQFLGAFVLAVTCGLIIMGKQAEQCKSRLLQRSTTNISVNHTRWVSSPGQSSWSHRYLLGQTVVVLALPTGVSL